MSPLPLLLMGFSSLTSDIDDIPQIPGLEAAFYIWAVSHGRDMEFLSYTFGLCLLTHLGGLTWLWCGILSYITGPDLLTLLWLSAICCRERG